MFEFTRLDELIRRSLNRKTPGFRGIRNPQEGSSELPMVKSWWKLAC